LNETKIDDI
jgi:exodeoxyribonuclease III